ncbi:Disease resistance protein RPM1 [Glycine soja]
MAEMAVSFARDKLLSLLSNEANMLSGIPKEFADIRKVLDVIQAFLKDADSRAADEGDNTNEGIRTLVKELRESSFRIEDVIDEYLIYVEQQPDALGCAALLCQIIHFIETLMPRHRIASEIQQIKTVVDGIMQRVQNYNSLNQLFSKQGQSSHGGVQRHQPRSNPRFLEDAEVVGFEDTKDELIGWLVEGPAERIVISVVGMGGLGKTTLVGRVFNNQKVTAHFDSHAWITVSQSYTLEKLMRDLLKNLCKEEKKEPPRDVSEMDQDSFIDEVRNHLQQKRYIVIFDDVWSVELWGQIKNAMLDNNNGNYRVKSKRLTRQWIAEGFVKEEEGKTVEDVAQQYLTELIDRSLVQVSSFTIDGKAKSCHVHDLLRDMILRKCKDLSFCQHISKEDESMSNGMIRRLSVATYSKDLRRTTESSHIRSLLVFTGKVTYKYVERIPIKYRLLKILDFEDCPLDFVPKTWGNLAHLKYLSLRRCIGAEVLVKFISKLQNLETLDIRNAKLGEMSKEICKLTKLRHLLVKNVKLFELKNGLGGMTSLQTLCQLSVGYNEDDDVVELLKELGKLKQLRSLGLIDLKEGLGTALCSTINELPNLEKLHIQSDWDFDFNVIDLPLISSLAMLRKLKLSGREEEESKEFSGDIKTELDFIQAFLKDADSRVVDEGDNTNEGIRILVKEFREASFRIEDVIDEYLIYVEQQPDALGCATLFFECDIAHFNEYLKHRHQIASEIQQIKSIIDGIMERGKKYNFLNQPSSQQGQSSYAKRCHARSDPRILKHVEVVGFEDPGDELIGWLMEGPAGRIVICGRNRRVRKNYSCRQSF